MAVEAMKGGAVEFLQKPFRDQELLDRIQSAMQADQALRRELEGRNALLKRYETLTPREKEILNHVVAGKANKVIAFDLGVSQRTVEIHRARVMQKMGARNLAELVRTQIRLEQAQEA